MKVAVITIEAPMPRGASHKDAVERSKVVAARALTGVADDEGPRVFGRVTGVTTPDGRGLGREVSVYDGHLSGRHSSGDSPAELYEAMGKPRHRGALGAARFG